MPARHPLAVAADKTEAARVARANRPPARWRPTTIGDDLRRAVFGDARNTDIELPNLSGTVDSRLKKGSR
jgi:hypothetical protein